MSDTDVKQPVSQPLIPPFLPHAIRRLAVPFILAWLGLVFITNTAVPQLEVVGKEHSVSMSPNDAPSMQAMKRVGQVFHEFNSDSSAMIVLEGTTPLGDDAHRFYDEMVHRLEQDTKHVQHVQDF
ncbi:MAG: MMPL family transporter, partial [Mycobacterium sp.]|nr:MMPL family transporter [Mycobacterium sp.]